MTKQKEPPMVINFFGIHRNRDSFFTELIAEAINKLTVPHELLEYSKEAFESQEMMGKNPADLLDVSLKNFKTRITNSYALSAFGIALDDITINPDKKMQIFEQKIDAKAIYNLLISLVNSDWNAVTLEL